MTGEILLYCVLALAMGYIGARRAFNTQLAALQLALDQKEKVLKTRISQLKTFRLAQRSHREVWSQVADELALPAPRRLLLVQLTNLLAEMPIPESPKTSLHGSAHASSAAEAVAAITHLVDQVGEGRIRLLWKDGSYEALHAMVRELVKLPSAANASDFGALSAVPDIGPLSGTVTSDFGGLEVTESFTAAAKRG